MTDNTTWRERLVIIAVAVLTLGPVLFQRGVVIVGDMSFVPDQPWKGAWLGLDGSVPRAVPADAVISAMTQVIPGDLVQKAILLGTLVAAGIGILRLVRRMNVASVGALAAAVLYMWNPYVAERLAIGHWGLLIGYAALPWVAAFALEMRERPSRSWVSLSLALGCAAVGSPTGGLMAVGLALVIVLGRAWRPIASVLAVGAFVNLPWLVPAMLASNVGNDRAGVAAFAARSDTPLGLLGSVATFGGIWKTAVVVGERGSWLLVSVALLVTVAGVVDLVRRRSEPLGRALLIAGALAAIVVLLPSTGIGAGLARFLVQNAPGGGLLRDSQKWLAPLVLAVCVGFAGVVSWLADRARRAGLAPRLATVGGVVAPLVLLPSLAWGLSGQLEPVTIPADWSAARAALDKVPSSQRSTVVLPFSEYERFSWNGNRAALDPAIRFFPGRVVTSDVLTLSATHSVAGDSAASAQIWKTLNAHQPLGPVLTQLGVRFVLLEKTAAGGATAIAQTPPGAVIYDGPELRLVDIGTAARQARSSHPGWIITVDALVAAALLLAVLRRLFVFSCGLRRTQ